MDITAAQTTRDLGRGALPVLAFAPFVLVVSNAAGRWDLAVYSLSFWHYLVYVLAFGFRRVPHRQFKTDAVLLKSIALAMLAGTLLSTGPGLPALLVMAAGFGLNIAAVRALGSDRTYYGEELAGLPAERTSAFPYSVVSHPMLIGNMAAFAAPLLDAEFRRAWWPLAALHVMFNLGILLMEIGGKPTEIRSTTRVWLGLAAGIILLLISFMKIWQIAAIAGLVMAAFGAFLWRCYTISADDRMNGTRKP